MSTPHDKRLFDRVDLDPAPTARLSFEVHGLLRNRTKTLEVELVDLSVDGAALAVGAWTPRDARDLRVHFGSVSTSIEIRSISTSGTDAVLHVRFRRPPPAFINRVRAFIEQASKADAANWLTVRRTWTGS